MRILFWDIDGTLLKTAKAGLYAFEEVVQELFSVPFDFDSIPTAGMTDYYIAHHVIKLATKREPNAREISHFIARYEDVLPRHLATQQGHLIPSVKEILAYVHNQPNYISLLLTGNTIIGAKAKLTHYGLDGFFDFTTSAFCDNCFNRNEISTHALSIVTKHYPTVTPDQIYIIGDTPSDIHCGKIIGARTIAVATGRYSLEELSSHTPWWGVSTLPSPKEFIENINR
jgi:phosphoglycolate phosphatase